jgi:hypothetical protein
LKHTYPKTLTNGANTMKPTHRQTIIDGAASLLAHTLTRHEHARFIGACVTSDILRDGVWLQKYAPATKHGNDPIYWVITECATYIGYHKSRTIDHARDYFPSTIIAEFVFVDGSWRRY